MTQPDPQTPAITGAFVQGRWVPLPPPPEIKPAPSLPPRTHSDVTRSEFKHCQGAQGSQTELGSDIAGVFFFLCATLRARPGGCVLMHMCADLLKICGHVKEKGSKETSLRISHRRKLVPALCSFSTFLVLLHLCACVRACVCCAWISYGCRGSLSFVHLVDGSSQTD